MEVHPFHPLANDYPLLEGDEFERFADDVAKRGLQVPIILWHGQLIDGRNRELACKARGVSPAYLHDDHVPEAELLDHIASLNEHRRHLGKGFLTRKRRERLKRLKAGRAEGKSVRQLAEEEQVSSTQVSRDLSQVLPPPVTPEADPAGNHPSLPSAQVNTPPYSFEPAHAGQVLPPPVTPETATTNGAVNGRDGKRYPARKPKPSADPAPVPSASEQPDTPPPPPKDPFGLTVPAALLPVFDPDLEKTRTELLSALTKAEKLLSDYAASPAGAYLARELRREGKDDDHVRYRHTGLRDLKSSLKDLAPHSSVCPYCHATGKPPAQCNCCEGRGWVPAAVFHKTRGLPPDYRAALEALREGA